MNLLLSNIVENKEAVIFTLAFILFLPIIFALLKFVFKLSTKIISIILTNSVSGLLLLIVLNQIGFTIPITLKNSIIVTILGIPGLFMIGVI